MKDLKPHKRIKCLKLYYTDEEFGQLQQRFIQSNSRFMGVYFRKVTLAQPVEQRVRNASFDDFIGEIIALRKEMSAIRSDARFTTETEIQLMEIYRAIQKAIDKIASQCIPT